MRFRPLLKWWLVLAGAALVLRLAAGASPARALALGAEPRLPTAAPSSF